VDAEISVDAIGRGCLKLGGHDLSKYVAGFALVAKAGERTQLQLDINASPVLSTCDVAVVLPEALRAVLVDLGWTPPTNERN
jgi:hypothetical protein